MSLNLMNLTPRGRTIYWIERFNAELLDLDERIGEMDTLGFDTTLLRAQREATDSQLQDLLRDLEGMPE